MSPKKESRRSSPRKPENSEKLESKTSSGSGIKLRLKVNKSSEEVPTAPNESTNDSVNATAPVTSVKIIKLNFSRSNESVPSPSSAAQQPDEHKGKGRRGRPKKDKSAVLAAAIAASQPNEAETEERKSRRRAAEEKIKKSISMDSVRGNNVVIDGEEDKQRKGAEEEREFVDNSGSSSRKRRRRRRSSEEDGIGDVTLNENPVVRRSRTNDFVDITDNHHEHGSHRNISSSVPSLTTSFNPQETEFIQRTKTFLNISYQHDAFMYTSLLSNPMDVEPFKSTEEMVEKLAAFHVGIGAGQYIPEELISDSIMMDVSDYSKHLDTLTSLQQRYRQVIHSQSSKKVPTELLLLEQRLCLEEEKFLLVKLKNEYAARFLKPSSSASASSIGSSRSSTPSG